MASDRRGSSRVRLRAALAIGCVLAVAGAATCGRKEPRRPPVDTVEAEEEQARTRRTPLERQIEPERVPSERSYDTQPDLALDAAGNPWVVWVGHGAPGGDRVLAARRAAGGWSAPEIVTPTAGMYLRPVIASSGTGSDELTAVWTATGDETGLWGARRTAQGWSAPERLSPPGGHHLNPELCTAPGGGLWMVWQSQTGAGFDLFLAHRAAGEGAWSTPLRVTERAGNDWDPSIACDSRGTVWIVWSAFADSDYDLFVAACRDGVLGPARKLTDHAAYDLHPALAIDPRDRIWITWDRLRIDEHGSSGTAEHVDGQIFNRPPPVETDAKVLLLCLDGEQVLVPEAPPSGGPPTHRMKNSALPRVACDAFGGVWVAYRAWSCKYDEPHTYWWDAAITRYAGGEWSAVEILEETDGNLEEPALVSDGSSVWLAAEMEHRRTSEANAVHPEDGPDAYLYSHHWPYMPQGVDGEIRVARLAADPRAAPLVLKPAPRLSTEAAPLASRAALASEVHHTLEYRGETLQVLFGDTHRHSNVSRCRAGQDATVIDAHRFALDVYRLDFHVVTDHSDHTSEFNSWATQKLTELFYMPGVLATLHGYEISNSFPTGHKNLIFPGRPSRTLRQGIDRANNGPEIWASLAGEEAITIPHTTAFPAGTDWEEHDPEYERLVEIFQARTGSSEHAGAPRVYEKADNAAGFVHAALDKGHRLGIIASTDHGFGAAYAVVFARAVTRADVYEALHERRCYGSTAYGIVLDVRGDGHLMGEEFEAASGVALAIDVRAYAPVDNVVVFADGEVAREWRSSELGAPRASLSWTDPDAPLGRPTARWYYVRVILADGEIAWSSPLWVSYEEAR